MLLTLHLYSDPKNNSVRLVSWFFMECIEELKAQEVRIYITSKF